MVHTPSLATESELPIIAMPICKMRSSFKLFILVGTILRWTSEVPILCVELAVGTRTDHSVFVPVSFEVSSEDCPISDERSFALLLPSCTLYYTGGFMGSLLIPIAYFRILGPPILADIRALLACLSIIHTIIRDQGPRDPSLLHLQATHRSRSVWRTGAAPLQYFRRRDANQSDLNIDVRLIPILQAAGFYGVARGVVLETIAARTADVLPDMSQLATQSLHHLRDRNAYKFDPRQVEEQDARQDGGGEDAGDKGGRGGGRRGRAGAGRGRARSRGGCARGNGGRGGGRLVDEPDDDADHADHIGTGEDRGPESSATAATATVADASAAAATATATVAEASTRPAAAAAAATTTGADTSTEQPPPVVQRQHRIRPWHGTPEVPPFDLGSSSQSTQSTQPSQPATSTQPSQPATQPSVPPFDVFYVRRSKRAKKVPDCGTGSHRG
ncbi:hypothetical protein ACET3Z_009375 [Daucus carota]